jgi:hypothetical protein
MTSPSIDLGSIQDKDLFTSDEVTSERILRDFAQMDTIISEQDDQYDLYDLEVGGWLAVSGPADKAGSSRSVRLDCTRCV